MGYASVSRHSYEDKCYDFLKFIGRMVYRCLPDLFFYQLAPSTFPIHFLASTYSATTYFYLSLNLSHIFLQILPCKWVASSIGICAFLGILPRFLLTLSMYLLFLFISSTKALYVFSMSYSSMVHLLSCRTKTAISFSNCFIIIYN